MFMQMDSGPEATLHRAATLVAKHISVINHSFEQHRHIPHTLLEILPKKKTLPSLFVLDVYSSPSEKSDDFKALFHDAIQVVQPRKNSLVIVGDFNAAHPTWGYVKENPKGRRLAQAIANNHLTIMTEPEHPTRIGNSRHRWFPNRYPGTCPGCGSDHPNLYHSIWECRHPLGEGITPIPSPTFSSWEAALSGTELDDQQRLVERARRIWAANGALD
ncbi:hypothetical protein ISCGN_004580 [Ixodes scapularis]